MLSPEAQAVAFGLLSATVMGAADFCGGWASRSSPFVVVIAVSHACGLGLLVIAALAMRSPAPSLAAVGWAAAAGLTALAGLVALYRAMTVGRVGVVAPASGVIAAALPVALTLATRGLPSTGQAVGFAMGMAGIWLIAQSSEAGAGLRGLGQALLAGVAFGVFFVFIARAGAGSVLWPLVAARLTSCLTATGLSFAGGRRPFATARRVLPLLLLSGGLDVAGNGFFVLAAHSGRLDIASVVSSLYPVSTIVLARMVLREPMNRVQVVGAVAAMVAIALIVAG